MPAAQVGMPQEEHPEPAIGRVTCADGRDLIRDRLPRGWAGSQARLSRARQKERERRRPETGVNRSTSAAMPVPSRERGPRARRRPPGPRRSARSPRTAEAPSAASRSRPAGPDQQTKRCQPPSESISLLQAAAVNGSTGSRDMRCLPARLRNKSDDYKYSQQRLPVNEIVRKK